MQKQLLLHVYKTIHAEHYLSPVHAYDRHPIYLVCYMIHSFNLIAYALLSMFLTGS